ncbi:pyridoxal phosphate-dependent decarboxylase family protein [Chondrinema litorale]|uniref:pyridoxal phosphate-dependent decarboxylase family protein n=1 Tax=Chondrinema litorale TaxID=2994555 RepID=UPI00254300C0|nr:pyridoxal-dependent decarboxylase [Chondrinema litorale]UZR95221.1 pyridoxal-dependent decarboxylase [Chondrinema litorale]
MNARLNNDLKDTESLLNAALQVGLKYLAELDQVPTSIKVSEEANMPELSAEGKGGLAILQEFKERFSEMMVASAGPRYWGFVTGGTTPAAIMGDMLATIYDQNTQTLKGHGDVSGKVEFETVQLLLDLFNLPKDYLGGFVTGATMSNFTCLGVARQWLGKELAMDVAKNGMQSTFKVLSAVPHSSAIKSLAMLGMGSANVQLVKTIAPTRECVDLEALEAEIKALNGQPFILISSGGTVNTVDFDDFKGISKLKEKYNFWWHVDAAFGGFAAISPSYSHLLDGWENADSICIDCHKWLNVPYESAFFFVKEKHKFLQVETFQNSNAPYLGDPLENFNFLNFLPENSRRFKALPAWFTLKAYGKDGYQEITERNIRQAKQLGSFINESSAFELLAPVRLNTVCFTLRGEMNEAKIQAFLDTLNDSGKVFMTPTFFNKRKGIRAALVNWRTTENDVLIVQQEMQKAFDQISKMSF